MPAAVGRNHDVALVEALDRLDLGTLGPSELYAVLKVVSRVRQEVWDEIAARPIARAYLSPRELQRLEETHGG